MLIAAMQVQCTLFYEIPSFQNIVLTTSLKVFNISKNKKQAYYEFS